MSAQHHFAITEDPKGPEIGGQKSILKACTMQFRKYEFISVNSQPYYFMKLFQSLNLRRLR